VRAKKGARTKSKDAVAHCFPLGQMSATVPPPRAIPTEQKKPLKNHKIRSIANPLAAAAPAENASTKEIASM
jgi:hypothetical protein